MPLSTTFDHVFAVPGQSSIVDCVDPTTGRTQLLGETLEQVQARYPGAVIMPWEEWRQEQIARQSRPIAWLPISRREYNYALDVLPPLDWDGGSFLVSEPQDHSFETGQARYLAYRQDGGKYHARFFVASRPMTRAEFQVERGKAV